MKRLCLLLAAWGSVAVARAEKPGPAGVSPDALKPAGLPTVPAKDNPGPQVNQNPLPGQQGPNGPAVQKPPDVSNPLDAVFQPGMDPNAVRGAGGSNLDSLRPGRETLGIDLLNADERRRDGGAFAPGASGFPSRDRDLDDAVEALRGVTGRLGSNRDPDKPGAGVRGAISTDPQALLTGARGGQASDSVGTAQGNTGEVKTVDHADGSRTTTEHHDRGDGHIQDITTHQDPEGTIKTQTAVERSPDGTVVTRTTERQTDGTYWNTVQIRNRDGSGRRTDAWRGPAPNVNVDPDSAYGKGSGAVVGPGQRPKDPKMVEALGGIGPGARPGEGASAGVAPRLDVDVNLAGQPNPGEPGGAAGGSPNRGYNPDDFVRPPRPTEP